jgi:chemotaxis protein CheD
VYVYPGRVIASASRHRLKTVLGSCVSVCLFDPGLRAGGMNHYLLPDAGGSESGSARFCGPAIQSLIGQLLGLGADQRRLVAKLFGGSGSVEPSANGFHVGWRNVQAARRILHDERIPIVAEDVGGRRGRRLFFDTAHGSALVSLI